MNVDETLKTMVAMIKPDTSPDALMKITQAALNLAHVAQVMAIVAKG